VAHRGQPRQRTECCAPQPVNGESVVGRGNIFIGRPSVEIRRRGTPDRAAEAGYGRQQRQAIVALLRPGSDVCLCGKTAARMTARGVNSCHSVRHRFPPRQTAGPVARARIGKQRLTRHGPCPRAPGSRCRRHAARRRQPLVVVQMMQEPTALIDVCPTGFRPGGACSISRNPRDQRLG